MKEYFETINKNVEIIYKIAEQARKKCYDPDDCVEVVRAKNVAERIVGLIITVAPQIKDTNIVERIDELEKEFGKQDWRVALKIALEVAQEKFCKFKNKEEAMEVGIRVGIAYITNGVVASPLEGFTELKIRKRKDGKEYFALKFSGPIRSAGGTAAAVSLLIGDYVRVNCGYSNYDPSDEEIKRMVVELYDYHERVTNLQYLPTEKEIEEMVKELPVQVDGDPSEEWDVSNYKDLPRIETNRLRNGPCLVLGEGIIQKASKMWKKLEPWYKDFNLDHWKFLEKFVKLQKKIRAKEKEGVDLLIKPDYTFIKELVAGRPVLTHPLSKGGFRLRYGRCRNSGLSSMAIHPATMVVLNNYIAIGTQLKVERPSKGTALSSCTNIEGPIIKLNNGNVIFLEDEENAKKYVKDIDEITFLGDILVNYGDFLDRGHVLVPCGYCEEWWLEELKEKLKEKFYDLFEASKFLDIDKDFVERLTNDFTVKVDFDRARIISERLEIPLHPRWTYHWKDISKGEFLNFIEWYNQAKIFDDRIIFPYLQDINKIIKEDDPKRVLELLGVPHKVVANESVVVEDDDARALAYSLGKLDKLEKENVLEIINENCKIKIKDKSGTFIGARMGRPEKAKMRKLKGSPHVLFPVGEEGGKLRCFQSCLEKGIIKADFPIYYCEKCQKKTIYPVCEYCDEKTVKMYYCKDCNEDFKDIKCVKGHKCLPYKEQELPISLYVKGALKKLKLDEMPELIKGIRGTSNEDHITENLAKGILRAMNDVYVNRDGTIRYDMTELCITAFKAKEIGTSVDRLKELGYDKDIYGDELVNDEQILELKPQDIIMPNNVDSKEEGCDVILARVANFVDDLLQYFYEIGRFYNIKSKKDLIGHLVVAIAPHISAGVIGRIIGFSKTQAFYAHPMFHCAIRRDVDGDEAAVILLMDALLNFSKSYLSATRGTKQDAPLVLTTNIMPSEIDDMGFNVDVVYNYPLEFYKATEEHKYPKEVNIETLRNRLGKENQYNFGFTHDTIDINAGVLCSAYKSLPSMMEKVLGQVELAGKIRAVDEVDVARLVIEKHFLRDIKGNLRQFSIQQFRCVDCNEKYRRPPLSGICLKCGGKIIFTVAEGSVIKYLEPSIALAEKYELPNYIRQSLELTRLRIESVFGKEIEKQEGLGRWF